MRAALRPLARRLMNVPDRLAQRPLAAPTDADRERIAALRRAFEALPLPVATSDSEAERFWVESQRRLAELVAAQDPREFLRWDVVQHTMFVHNHRYVLHELQALLRDPRWLRRWRPAVRESAIGRPPRYFAYPWSSGNLLHHTYHLWRYEYVTGAAVTDVDTIVEFGGGYGSMCRLLRRLGFRGRYVIFDLPQFSALQRFFLESQGPDAPRIAADRADVGADVYLLSDPEQLQAAVTGGGRSMLLATWSLSEAPVRVREQVFDVLAGCERFLLAYQETFGEVDNVAYFKGWRGRIGERRWRDQTIPHLPGSRYLFGL